MVALDSISHVFLFHMSDSLTISPWSNQRSSAGNEYWQIAREIKKQEAVYPKLSRAMIKSAVEFAVTQSGHRRDPQEIDRYIAMYLSSGKTP